MRVVATEANWLLIMVDTTRMTGGHTLQERAEVILADMRGCPPSRGFDRVQILKETHDPVVAAARRVLACLLYTSDAADE